VAKRRYEAAAFVNAAVDRTGRPSGNDPLIALHEATTAFAQACGLSDGEIEAELRAYNGERRG
jgi:hypothetical protein